MLRQGTTWLACIAVGLVSLTVAPDNADAAAWRRAARRGGCNNGYAYNNGWQNGGACCGTVQPIQQTACCGAVQQPAYQQATYQPAGGACSVQQSGYQTFNHTSGYAPQGQVYQQGQIHHQGQIQHGGIQTDANRQPPPPPSESDEAPRTFDKAPEPNESDRSDN
ncbi:MAG TPA: hypothetical protein VM165_23375 [Planctomycetaceae bacterium]|nr:hypothetical protein [Planctomycetaceae bacterium]